MNAADELRQKYEDLVRRKDAKRRDVEEARTQVRIGESKLQEVTAEAKLLGFETLEVLEQAIQQQKSAIEAEITALDLALQQENIPTQQPEPRKPATEIKEIKLDDLLSVGST